MEIFETQSKTYLTPITKVIELGYRTSPICASGRAEDYKVDDENEIDFY